MKTFYISFGQAHTHRIDGKTYDCDSLMKVEAENEIAARLQTMDILGNNKWSSIYPAADLEEALKYYPRGVLNA